ncbi:prefoldin subunit alpha [Candidatus Woesearchaeota archaeon]|nr:prefoldin subunit alpha [Candidatus Woesearchaeota archaeon]
MPNKEEDNQKYIAQQILGQQLQQIEQQIASVDMQIIELISLKDSLIELTKVKSKKIYTPLGAGVFIESELKKVDDVLVNVGAGIVVKKDANSAAELISSQVEELKKIKDQIQKEFDELVSSLR